MVVRACRLLEQAAGPFSRCRTQNFNPGELLHISCTCGFQIAPHNHKNIRSNIRNEEFGVAVAAHPDFFAHCRYHEIYEALLVRLQQLSLPGSGSAPFSASGTFGPLRLSGSGEQKEQARDCQG